MDDLSCFFTKWATFCDFLPEKLVKTPKHRGCFEKCPVFAKSTIFSAFSRNEGFVASFGWKICQNAETRWFLRKVESFGQIDVFSCFFAKWATFCDFWLKISWKDRNTVVSSKSCKFWPNRRFFPFFHEMRHFLRFLPEKFVKTPKNGAFLENLEVLAKLTIFRGFSRNEAPFATFGWRVCQNPETRCFLRKVASLGQIDDLSCFFLKWGNFCALCLKSSSKRRNTVVASKSWKFWPNRLFLVLFREMRDLLRLLAEKFVKRPKLGAFFETLQDLNKATIFRVFSPNEALFAPFGWKVRQKAKTRRFLRKVASFGEINDFSCFFAKWGTFCDFWLKSSSKRRNTVVSSRSVQFWPNRRFFVFVDEMRHLLPLLAKKFVKTPKHGGFFEKLQVFAKATIFRVVSGNEALSAFFAWKGRRNAETWCFLRRVASLGQIDDFSCFFREMSNFLRILAEKFVKTPKHVVFFEKFEVLAKWTIFVVFSLN